MIIIEFNNKIVIYEYMRCDCGKFKGFDNAGIICDRCGIENRDRAIYFNKKDFHRAWSDRKIVNYPKKKNK